jgi:hypothetical protein
MPKWLTFSLERTKLLQKEEEKSWRDIEGHLNNNYGKFREC